MRALAFLLALSATAPARATGKPYDTAARFVQRTLGVASYKRADADLNDDGRSEAFVYVTDRSYCGSGGCTLFVLSRHRRSYRIVLRSTLTQLPIRLLSTSTHGWRDIAVTVAGGGVTRPHLAHLRFNGRRYPSNPTVSPAIPLRRRPGRLLIRR
jgi:hypothetical protein